MARPEEPMRRVFVALDLDDDVRHGLAAHLREWQPLPGSSPPPANWHITLRFVGKTDPPGYEKLLARLDETDLGPGFDLGFGTLDAFPRAGRATVLWLGTAAGSAELVALAATVEAAVVAAGAIPEERPFHPHLTLSRIRPPRSVQALIEAVPPFPLRQPVRAVTVFESHLGRGPAVYEVLEVFDLG